MGKAASTTNACTQPDPAHPPTPQPSADSLEAVQRPAWAEYLISLRKRHNLTAREAAERMGVTQQTYAGIEAGTRTRNGRRIEVTPKDETLHRVAKALNLNATERRHLFALVTTGTVDRRPWQTRLKFARIAASISQPQAAQAAGVTVATYREWEHRNSGVPRHEHLRKLLTHLGWNDEQVTEFMATIPPDTAPARAPQQPTNPINELPRWSQFLTTKRLEAGLYLTQLDAILGQQSIVRRFELGGWARSDGRLSVPSCDWLDRIADALTMSPTDRAHLHLLADHHRLTVAAQGPRPFTSEVFHEARKAVDVTRTEANNRVGFKQGTWNNIEMGHPETLDSLTSNAIETAIARLPIGSMLAAALRSAVPNVPQPADNTKTEPLQTTVQEPPTPATA